VTIPLYSSDECLLPLNPAIAISNMLLDIGKQRRIRTEFVLFCD
jgi:hypothetical protein